MFNKILIANRGEIACRIGDPLFLPIQIESLVTLA